MTRPRVGISRCLLGDHVRHDGRHKYEASLLEALAGQVEWVPVCPEVECGMGVPREPVQLVMQLVIGGREGPRLTGVESGRDWTDRMQAWSEARLETLRAERLAGFVLKSRSPSCGVRDIPVAGGQAGAGLFARALRTAMPELPVEDEARLRDPHVREAFLARVRALTPTS